MKPKAIEFWILLAATGLACLLPIWPPLLAWWFIIALLWERRYSEGCWRALDSQQLTIYIGEALICLPLILTALLASGINQLGGKGG